MSTPNNWRTVALGDLLTHAQIKQVLIILRRKQDQLEATRQLKEYLNTFKAQLEGKGVLPDYLAYVLIYKQNEILLA